MNKKKRQNAQSDIEDTIPLLVPTMNGLEGDYLEECVRANWVSYAGPFVDEFEGELAKETGARYAVATASGTAALHCALILAGVSEHDEVLMPGITFVAPANAILYCGAIPVFLDLEPGTWQLDASQLEDFFEFECERVNGSLVNKRSGRVVRAVVLVHLLGCLGDRKRIGNLCSRYGVFLVEDAAEALGCEYAEGKLAQPVSEIADEFRILATSFNGNKIITTGGGGAILTNNKEAAARARHITTTAKVPGLEFEHDELGFNYRMTSLAAALGLAQLRTLAEYVARKRAIADTYAEQLKMFPEVAELHPEPVNTVGTFWLYTVKLAVPSMPVVHKLAARGVQSRPIWKPMPDLPYLKKFSCYGELTVGRALQKHAISLPCSVSITSEEQQNVVDNVGEVLERLADPKCADSSQANPGAR